MIDSQILDKLKNGELLFIADINGKFTFLKEVSYFGDCDGVSRPKAKKTGDPVRFIPNVTVHDGSEFEEVLIQIMGVA